MSDIPCVCLFVGGPQDGRCQWHPHWSPVWEFPRYAPFSLTRIAQEPLSDEAVDATVVLDAYESEWQWQDSTGVRVWVFVWRTEGDLFERVDLEDYRLSERICERVRAETWARGLERKRRHRTPSWAGWE